jgi:tripartite-type tricarboxylate transporter receptor subunit TctC
MLGFTRGPLKVALAALAVAVAQPAWAQADYPNRPIRLIVGFAAGGGNDLFARLVGQKMSALGGPS